MTYIKDDTKKEKRKKVVKNSREELIDALFDHYKHPDRKSPTLDGGINLNTVREAVGHQDERTTLQSYLYDRSGDEEVKTKFTDVIDRIHVG